MLNDLRSSPAWTPVGVIVSVISLILSSFSNASTLVKMLVIVVGLIACLYFLFNENTRSTISSSSTQKSTGSTPASSPTLEADAERNQVLGISDVHYPQTPPNQPVSANPTVSSPAMSTGTASPAPSWKERLGLLLVCAIMYGLPGVLLFRSNVGWQHIVGIILLVFAVFGVIGTMVPES